MQQNNQPVKPVSIAKRSAIEKRLLQIIRTAQGLEANTRQNYLKND